MDEGMKAIDATLQLFGRQMALDKIYRVVDNTASGDLWEAATTKKPE